MPPFLVEGRHDTLKQGRAFGGRGGPSFTIWEVQASEFFSGLRPETEAFRKDSFGIEINTLWATWADLVLFLAVKVGNLPLEIVTS